jgi:alkanesulfonate monooxygenase SsuD/methylene tetrahydromethanopterin reductase-like flavin-dependent oxidoreductase (luciferase family)
MRIGIFQDLRNPPQWRRPWAQHYQTGLDRAVRAEVLGLDSVWFSEHHFFEDGYLPQPFVYAAAVAARTTSIRLGTAIAIAPLYPAIDIAEKATMVDLISNGRFSLGSGAGYRQAQYDGSAGGPKSSGGSPCWSKQHARYASTYTERC